MNLSFSQAAALPTPPFQLNERVTHATYGAGTIRGFIHRNGELLWLVNFDRKPTIEPPDGAVAVPQLFPVASAQLQKA